jgi:hypothetical protein
VSQPTTAAPERARLWPPLVTVVALATLPYLSLLAANVDQGLDLRRVGTWWLATLAVGLGLVALAARRSRTAARRVGALVGVALYLFFNYPAVTGLRRSLDVPLGDLAWWGLVSAVVVAAAAPVTRRRGAQVFLAVWAPVLLLLPLAQLATAGPAEATPDGSTAEGPGAGPDAGPAAGDAPELTHRQNVYWFILDGQAGPPFLREELGLDPDPFLDHLRDRGFRVLEQARSNYPFTHLAVPSALEMAYLYEDVPEPAPGPYFERLQGDNATVDLFRANGYGYVHAFPGLWTGSRCSGREDVCLGAHGTLSDTEFVLASATPLIEVLADAGTAEGIARANDPLAVTEQVLRSAPDEPYFALIHLLNPHPPYLRDADCGLRDVRLVLGDWGEGREYADAVTCLFQRLETAVDRILAADDDPVVVIQGDHGPRLGLSPETSGEVLLDDDMFFSALSVMRLPAPCDDLHVPDDLTIVNTFRVVFACLQDEPPELLPDRLFPILRDY